MEERWGCRNVIVSEWWGLMSVREQYRNQPVRLLSVIGVYWHGHIWSAVRSVTINHRYPSAGERRSGFK